MRTKEVIERLEYELRRKVSYRELGNVLNVEGSAIGNRVSRNIEFKQSEIEKIENYFEVKINNSVVCDKNMVSAKLYTNVIGSCGNGVFEQSQNYELVQVPKFIIKAYNPRREYAIITAKGNSMNETIKDGDKLLVENFLNSDVIEDNEIYVFCYEDSLYIKRLIKNIDQIIVKSDNLEIPIRYIEKENMNNMYIIGKIVASVRNYFK